METALSTTSQVNLQPPLPSSLKIAMEVCTPIPEILPEYIPAITAAMAAMRPTPSRERQSLLWTEMAGVLANQKLYNTPMDPEAVRARKVLWLDILGDYPIDAIHRAIVAYCTAKDDVPTAGNIRDLAEKDLALMKVRHRYNRLKKMKEKAQQNQGGNHA